MVDDELIGFIYSNRTPNWVMYFEVSRNLSVIVPRKHLQQVCNLYRYQDDNSELSLNECQFDNGS